MKSMSFYWGLACLPKCIICQKQLCAKGQQTALLCAGATPNNTPVPSSFVKQQQAFNAQHPHSIMSQLPNALSAEYWLAKAQAKEAAGDLEVTCLLPAPAPGCPANAGGTPSI